MSLVRGIRYPFVTTSLLDDRHLRYEALLSAGRCPFCGTELSPLDESPLSPEDVATLRRWASPPVGWCPLDDEVVGRLRQPLMPYATRGPARRE